MLREGWCLVLAIWGEKYADAHVNVAVRTARAHSLTLRHAVLFTDRARPGIDSFVEQHPFPEFFRRPEWFTHGFIAKLAMFSRADLPADMRCVYVDLDTIITGDLGQIAALVRGPNDYLMLPPGNLIGFGPLRRAMYRMTGGRAYAVGNSSILAYSSAAEPNLYDTFRAVLPTCDPADPKMHIDDRFISWFAQPRLRAVPRNLAVMFRREFLSHSRLAQVLKGRLGPLLGRRRQLVAITLNGIASKPEQLRTLADGARIEDLRGRFGYWTAADLGPARTALLEHCAQLEAADPTDEPVAATS